jgi:hypothetical protein
MLRTLFVCRTCCSILLALVAFGAISACSGRSPRGEDRAAVTWRVDLARHRAQQIERLHAYAAAGVFPRHPGLPSGFGLLPVFKDEEGRRCAVANLVYRDGLGEVVDRTAREHNDVIVAEEASGPLHDWVLMSGLTREEVSRIQGVAILEAYDNASLQAMLARYLGDVERELIASTEVSLRIAAQRLEASKLSASWPV